MVSLLKLNGVTFVGILKNKANSDIVDITQIFKKNWSMFPARLIEVRRFVIDVSLINLCT
jgi:hypothetical protein